MPEERDRRNELTQPWAAHKLTGGGCTIIQPTSVRSNCGPRHRLTGMVGSHLWR
jgi:hypothetical protein